MSESPGYIPDLDKKALREYSKQKDVRRMEQYGSPGHTSRQYTAEWLQKQRQRRQEQDDYSQDIARHMERDLQVIEDYRQERLSLEQQEAQVRHLIKDHESSWVRRLTRRINHDYLTQQQETLEGIERKQAYASQMLEIKSRILESREYEQEFENIRRNKERLSQDAQAYLSTYYDQLQASWRYDERRRMDREALEDYKLEHGGVAEQLLDRGQYLVHAVKPKFDIGFGNNRAVNNQSDYVSRMAYMVAEQPTACTSSFGPSTTGESISLWDNFGVVLNGGVIEDAFAYDAATRADQNGNRVTAVGTIEQYNKNIQQAIAQGSRAKYNEIVTSSPESVAVFINGDQVKNLAINDDLTINGEVVLWQSHSNESRSDYSQITVADLAATATKLQLPMMLFQHGQGFLLSGEENGSFRVGESVSPEQLQHWQRNTDNDAEIADLARAAAYDVLAIL
jgi:hypothetical protein